MKVIFVCLGNICRSPMAESLFRQMVIDAGLADQIQIDSAGTSDIAAGSPADSRTKAVLAEHDLSADGLIARQLNDQDFYDADYILVMDQMNMLDARSMAPAGLADKVHGIYMAVAGKEDHWIVDPWITHRFHDTYESLSEALPAWLKRFQKELNRA